MASSAAPGCEQLLEELRRRLRGDLILPEDPLYDSARRVYNAMHDRRPGLIVHASGVADVIHSVRFAARHRIPVAVRGGGHSVPGFGTCDDGMVVDLRRMRGIRVDPRTRNVRAEGGCTWGDLNHATHAFGLATTGGIVSTTGIAGLTLGGGLGFLSRRCGLACDNLVSADVVLADGSFVTCSEGGNADLFWALRGGGGNFGVVTSFEYRLHPVKEVLGGPLFFPLAQETLRAARDFLSAAPPELGAVIGVSLAPPLPFVPPHWQGKPVCAVVACWTGKTDTGRSFLADLMQRPDLIGAGIRLLPYPEINTLFDELVPAGLQQYWKGRYVRELSDEAIGIHVKRGATIRHPQTGTFLFPLDGEARLGTGTAFPEREAAFATVIAGAWPDAADNEMWMRWVREYDNELASCSDEGSYVNFLSGDDEGKVRASYGGNYGRLENFKTHYDPGNLFRFNQNIRPAAERM